MSKQHPIVAVTGSSGAGTTTVKTAFEHICRRLNALPSIVEGDSLQTMPFVHITVKNARIGTISDYYGFFSLVANEGDTIEFSSVGYHRNQLILPDSMAKSSYSLIHVMMKDTVLLN